MEDPQHMLLNHGIFYNYFYFNLLILHSISTQLSPNLSCIFYNVTVLVSFSQFNLIWKQSYCNIKKTVGGISNLYFKCMFAEKNPNGQVQNNRPVDINSQINLDEFCIRINFKIKFIRSAAGPDSSGAMSSNRRLQQTQAQVDEVRYTSVCLGAADITVCVHLFILMEL